MRGRASGDTSFAHGPKGFPPTTWALISHLRAEDSEQRREGLEALCRRYWRPIYIYLRIAWRESNEDAKEVTQAFLLSLVEGESLRKFEPARGSFRGFLKMLLVRFLKDQNLAKRSIKRGGKTRIVSLGEMNELPSIPVDGEAEDPESEFDKAWAVSVVTQAVQRIREKYESTGRLSQFQVYQRYEQAPEGDRPTYADIGKSRG